MDDNTSIQFRLRLAQINGIKMNESTDHVSTEIDHMPSRSHSTRERKFGIKITPSKDSVQSTDHTVTGPRENVKKFLIHHYGGDEGEARELHPEVFGN